MNGLAFRPTSQVIDKKNKKKKKKKTPRDRGVISFVSFVSFVFFSLPHVIRLSLGKLLVNLLQVGKRTNTPLIPQQMASSAEKWVFGSSVRAPHPPYIVNFFRLSPCRTWKILFSPASPGNETAWILTGPPVCPADLLSRRFRGEECDNNKA